MIKYSLPQQSFALIHTTATTAASRIREAIKAHIFFHVEFLNLINKKTPFQNASERRYIFYL